MTYRGTPIHPLSTIVVWLNIESFKNLTIRSEQPITSVSSEMKQCNVFANHLFFHIIPDYFARGHSAKDNVLHRIKKGTAFVFTKNHVQIYPLAYYGAMHVNDSQASWRMRQLIG